MYNIKALEEEWRKYNRKKRRPFYLLLFVLVLIGVGSLVLFYAEKIPEFPMIGQSEERQIKIENKSPVLFSDDALTHLENKKPAEITDAPMDIGEDITVVEPSAVTQPAIKKKLHIEVIEAGSTPSSYKEIEKRFRMGHDTDDSLFLAKSYYRKGHYKKAEYWALQTNKVNGNIEESWLIFAKAKVKRGRRNEAIKILNTYIQRTHSAEAKVLLEKIKEGKI